MLHNPEEQTLGQRTIPAKRTVISGQTALTDHRHRERNFVPSCERCSRFDCLDVGRRYSLPHCAGSKLTGHGRVSQTEFRAQFEKSVFMTHVVVIDDDRSVCEMIRRSLAKIEVKVHTFTKAGEALNQIRESSPDVVLLDIMLPEASGLDVFQQIREIDRKLPIVFITAGTDSSTAIRAMQLGGYDYVTKPLDLPSLNDLVRQAIATRQMMNIPVALHMSDDPFPDTELLVGRSPAMLEVFKSIGRVAAQNVPVLIRGESGTGKELVARALYQNSARSSECFMAVNCAALPDALLESELFGHEKGSFTGADKQRIGKFEACNGGTIFLDEIGDMSPLVQGKVLRLLQQQEFERVGGNTTIKTDVRIITATNLDLDQMVVDGEFREDLFYRLNGITITLPPLRKRGDDVSLLLAYYLRVYAREMNRDDCEGISPEALELLKAYSWPGNVREMQSIIRQALLNATGPVIVPSFLPSEITSATQSEDPDSVESSNETGVPSDLAPFVNRRLKSDSRDLYAETLEQMERYLITRVLQATDGNQTRASEILGITRGKIRDRVNLFQISLDTDVSLEH
jgi:DNA-binding NtrC family response regulator